MKCQRDKQHNFLCHILHIEIVEFTTPAHFPTQGNSLNY